MMQRWRCAYGSRVDIIDAVSSVEAEDIFLARLAMVLDVIVAADVRIERLLVS